MALISDSFGTRILTGKSENKGQLFGLPFWYRLSFADILLSYCPETLDSLFKSHYFIETLAGYPVLDTFRFDGSFIVGDYTEVIWAGNEGSY